jgi:hypothetical protein
MVPPPEIFALPQETQSDTKTTLPAFLCFSWLLLHLQRVNFLATAFGRPDNAERPN